MQSRQLHDSTTLTPLRRQEAIVSETVSVGLLISTYNWPEALKTIFLSIAHQTRLPDEILIADDGSDEETRRVIHHFQKKLRVPITHAWQHDYGFRKSIILNKVMKSAKADYIIQIDGDIIMHPKFIEDHLKNAEYKKFIQGSRTLLTPEKTHEIFNTSQFKFRFFSRGIKHRFNSLRIPFLSFIIKSDPNSSENIKGCNFSFWKKDFIAVNGYNNSFHSWGWEDNEFAARLINAGVQKKRLKLAAICYHLHHDHNIGFAMNELKYNETIECNKRSCENGYVQV